MATMTEMLEQLAHCEKVKFNAELEASVLVREAEAEVTESTQRLLEVIRAHEQQLKVLKAQCEKRFRDAGYQAGQMVRKAEANRAAAEGHAEASCITLNRTEKHVRCLEDKVRDLQVQLHMRTEECENRVAETSRTMQTRVERVSTQADQRVHSMLQSAREVFEAADASLESTADELQEQMGRAQMRSEGRTRFKELCELSKTRQQLGITQPDYEACKGDILTLWGAQTFSQTTMTGAVDDMEPQSLNSTMQTNFGEAFPASPASGLGLGMSMTGSTGATTGAYISPSTTQQTWRQGSPPATPPTGAAGAGALRSAGASMFR